MTNQDPTSKKVASRKQRIDGEKIPRPGIVAKSQKAHQDPHLKRRIKLDERKQELLDQTQSFMYQQSSKFSAVSRSLVFGIIGTVWVLTYTDGNLRVPNVWLLSSLITGLVFLLVDVIHYYWDSMSYYKESYKLDGYKSQLELDEEHEPRMDFINKRSHWFVVGKFWILMIAALLFFIGLINKILIIDISA